MSSKQLEEKKEKNFQRRDVSSLWKHEGGVVDMQQVLRTLYNI